MENRLKTLTDNFISKNIDVKVFDNIDYATDYILSSIPTDMTVGIGNSRTLKDMNISQKLSSRGSIVYDKTMAREKEEIIQIKKKSLTCDYYITSSNAVSSDGHIVNIDHSGNRVAAMIFGPDKVFVVIGTNKIVSTLAEAKYRTRNVSAPLNAKRAGYNPPCIEVGHCVDCKSPERVCYNHVVIEGQHIKDRLTLIVIKDNLGF